MATFKIATIATYQGLSSDDKPYSIAGSIIPEGSTFHCVDTGENFVFFNDGWVPDLRMARAFRESLLLP